MLQLTSIIGKGKELLENWKFPNVGVETTNSDNYSGLKKGREGAQQSERR